MNTEELLDIASQLRTLAGRLEALAAEEPSGRLYATLCEAQPAETEAPDEPIIEPEAEPEEPAKPAISFALNDRYRFLRELFGGSTEAMDSAVGAIAELQSAADVESYLTDNGFDIDSDTVKDFLRATTRRFDSHPPLLG